MNYVGEKPASPVEFQIYPDARGEASTVLYEDDGLTESYLQGTFRRTGVSYRNNQIELAAPTGSYRPAARDFVFRRGKATARVTDDGGSHRLELR